MNQKLFNKSSIVRTDRDDPRGSTFKAELDGREYLFLNMSKGALRGGHYHSRETFHLVLQGRIQFEFVDPSTGEQTEVVAGPMDIIRIPAGIAHLLKAEEDAMFMEPLNNGTIHFEPQRSQVTKHLEKMRQ